MFLVIGHRSGRLPCCCWPVLTCPLSRNGGQVVILYNPSIDRAAGLSPPQLWLNPPCDAPQLGVALSDCCSSGDAQVDARSSLYADHHIKVMKSVKMKPPEAALLGLLSFHIVLQIFRRFALQASKRFRGSSPNSKSLCKEVGGMSSPARAPAC
jgi:hypothetical protein